MKDSLDKIYQRNRIGLWPDKGTDHTYIEVYEEILKPYRGKSNVLEIGLFTGQSLRMWEQYFDEGKVWGIDCSDQPLGGMQDLRPMISEGTHNIIIMDGTSAADIKKHFKDIQFDVIIDDGSHQLTHQLESYKHFKKHLSKGGIYIIEDVQDIDSHLYSFENIDKEKRVTILDRRHLKNRYDDVLVIIQDK